MRSLRFLLWIFAGVAETLVLRPSLNVSMLQNVSTKGDSWTPEWSANNLRQFSEEQKWEETIKSHVSVVMTEEEKGSHNERTGEGEHGTLQEDKLLVEDRQGADEDQGSYAQEQEKRADEKTNAELTVSEIINTGDKEPDLENMHGFDNPEKYLNWSESNAEREDLYPSVALPTLPQNNNVQSKSPVTSLPSSYRTPTTLAHSTSTTKFSPTVTLLSAVFMEQTASPSVTEMTLRPSPVTKLPTMSAFTTSKNDTVSVLQIETGTSKLRSKGTQTVTPTAMAVRSRPTDQSLSSGPKPKPAISNTKIKVKQMANKKKSKKPNKHKAKEKKITVVKNGKNMKKLKQEKDKLTSAPYFPYFTDNYCPPDCACYGRVVQCSDKELDKIPYGIPYNSYYILLMNNHIDSIPLDLLSEYLSMEFLVLSNNHLTDSSIEGAFEGIQALKRLYLEQNLLQSIPMDLPSSLEELRLDGNKVRVMSEAAWSRCPGLLILSLSNNSLGGGLSTIPSGALSLLSSLRTLSLSHNWLTSVPLHLPLSLQELYLRGNLIQRFQGGVFLGKAELQVLDLSANRLTNKGLGKTALINATCLESLNLEGNFLKQVPRHLPRSLKILNLEGNSISSISKAAFLSLPHLEHLGLARNKISKVAPGAFRILPLLHQLDLSHNALQQVPRRLPPWLVSVAMTNNKIHTIPRDAFCWADRAEMPSRLVRVQLEHNLIDLGRLDSHAFNCLRGYQVVHFY